MYDDRLFVIIPCFNEGNIIFNSIRTIFEYLQQIITSFEIIAVNDGSKDNTLQELQRAASVFPLRIMSSAINHGKGRAIKDGILASKNDVVMFSDADLSVSIEELGPFLDALHDGNDMVFGCRFIDGYLPQPNVFWYRKIKSATFRGIRIAILGRCNVDDTQCGFKLFRRDMAMKIFSPLTVERFTFDSEIVFLAYKMGYTIKEWPVTFHSEGKGSVHFILDPINMTIDLIKIGLNYIFGKYSLMSVIR